MFKKLVIIFALVLFVVSTGFAQESKLATVNAGPTLVYGTETDTGLAVLKPGVVSRVDGGVVTAELTADTLAQPVATDWGAEILKVILGALGSLASVIGLKLIPLINAWLKAIMHYRGASVVADAVTQAFAEMLEEFKKAASDGTVTAEERAFMKKRAKEIAEGKLKNLSGFYKKDLIGWLDEVLEVELGKLLSRIFSYKNLSSAIP